jgi:hypothetical protein
MSTPPSSAAHGTWFCTAAVLYSAWNVNGVPSQLVIEVSMNPFAALAVIHPVCPVLRSRIVVVNPCGGSVIDTWITSPGLISRVWALDR